MATIRLPPDFRDFLRLLNSHDVRYLLIGGYAVGYHGYPRATGDMDIWVERTEGNATKLMDVLRDFGFANPSAARGALLEADRVVRMGVPPIRIELLTGISGVSFDKCYASREAGAIDGIPVNILALDDLKANKKAAGRLKDLADLEELP